MVWTEQLPAPGDRVVVAMSGGVDSSVAAALLHERGCEVIGLTLSLYEEPDPDAPEGGCCTPSDILDARRVCRDLGVRHYLLNARQVFQESVIDPFVDAYRAGETPNPCVRCNNHLKFDLLVVRARQLEAKWMATGHYAQLFRDEEGGIRLFRGRDADKDQSYFLYGMTSDVMEHLCFPLGGWDKADVRREAERLSVRTQGKGDSQDVCFIPDGRTAAFVERQGGAGDPGTIVDEAGVTLGSHNGVHGYTIGQRRGLRIAPQDPLQEPLYVRRIDAARRRLVVATADRLEATEVWASSWHWLRRPVTGESLFIKARSQSPPVSVACVNESDRMHLELSAPVRAAAPGQAVVLYGGPSGREVLGGGTLAPQPATG